jgi:hypothetical protein
MKRRFYNDEEGEEQGEGLGRPDHAVRGDEFWNEQQERKRTRQKFTPKRRGPAKIIWPLAAEKALMRLTGRPTLAKAKIAYLHYAVARYIIKGWTKKVARDKAKKELRHNLETGPWTLEFFKDHAREYAEWARPNFDAAVHKQRLSNFLSGLSSKQARS